MAWKRSRNPVDDILEALGFHGDLADKVSGIISILLMLLIIGLFLGGM